MRFVSDFLKINEAIIPDKYPPFTGGSYDRVLWLHHFLKLDMYNSYLQIPLHEDFFGYSVSAVGERLLESNVKATLDLPEPKNTKELAPFLGTTFYLSQVRPKLRPTR